MRSLLLPIALCAAAACSACFSPSFDSCAVTCGSGDSCPSGMTCLGDGICHRSRDEALCTPRPDADPNQPDADPDQPDADLDRPDAGPAVTPDTFGQLVINEMMIDSAADPEQPHEWFEIYNPSESVSYELQGLWLADTFIDLVSIDASLIVRPGGYVVLGENADTGANGGVAVDYDWGPDTDFNLTNGDDEVILYNPDADVVIDEVDYGVSWFVEGAALNLDPASQNADDNDSMASWCDATTVYDDVPVPPDKGTPGVANPDC